LRYAPGAVLVPLSLFGPLGIWEILLILVLVVFLFGARRLPDIARGLGEGIRNFRSSLRGDDQERGPGDQKKDDPGRR
jgi:sec-independent protein translocase protein TatA